jgi:uncharacterized membrane protein
VRAAVGSGGPWRRGRGSGPLPPARPAWELVGLAAMGTVVAGYLTWTKLTGGAPVCGGGEGCAIVQASRYAVFLSAPTAAWGVAFYAVVGLLGLRGLTARRWMLAFGLSAAGVAFSAYLTGVALFSIRATCALCLTSAGLTLAILAVLLWRRARVVRVRAAARPARLIGWGVGTAAVTVALTAWLYAMAPEAWAPRQQALAAHLRQSGAVMYGAYWCPVCREQKAQFGSAADHLPYVECDPSGPGARPERCVQAGVRRYPTWAIGGRMYEGLLTLDELARLSGFAGWGAAPPGG